MITKLEALKFLKEHQPMPCDEKLTKDIIQKYEEIRKFFLSNKDEECIPLLLNSFGGKDGFGVYQMVEEVIMMFDKKEVLPHIVNAFENSSEGVIYWNVQIASNFPDEILFKPLVEILRNGDEDTKLATITALAQLALNNIKVIDVIEVIKKEASITTDEDIIEFAEEVLDDIQNSVEIN